MEEQRRIREKGIKKNKNVRSKGGREGIGVTVCQENGKEKNEKNEIKKQEIKKE